LENFEILAKYKGKTGKGALLLLFSLLRSDWLGAGQQDVGILPLEPLVCCEADLHILY